MHKPLADHWTAVKCILRYLAGTLDQGLQFHRDSELRFFAFYDSDQGSDPNYRKSISGYCEYLGSNLVAWSSKKQHVISRSSTKAEFRSMTAALIDILWLQNLLFKLHVSCSIILAIFCDNQSIVLLAANPILHSHSKHFELDLYFVRDKIAQKLVHVSHIPSTHQIADILSKPLSAASLTKFFSKLRASSNSTLCFVGG